jgi:tRNA modification GTPase
VPADTVVALASPPGPSARAILRLSGPRALEIAAALAGLPQATVRGARRGRIEACGAAAPAVVLAMPAPRSYTREDVAEIHVAGAAPLAAELLRRACAAGARLAAPGEFTRRAWENGRISLDQAEAVLAVIRARDDAELRRAAERLAGRGGEALAGAAAKLAALTADVEASIDFQEHDIPVDPPARIDARAEDIERELRAASSSRPPADDSPRVLLVGKPNAGKSSLFNALSCGRALTSPEAGTTRDFLEAEISVGSVSFRLVDSAGLDGDKSGAGAAAAVRARAARADVRLGVVDASRTWTPPPDCDVLALNKVDLGVAPDARPLRSVAVSALTGIGLGRLRARLALAVRRRSGGAESVLAAREHDAARRAAEALARARAGLQAGLSEDLVALDLREGLDALGEVTGAVATEDLLDRIFARFCIGK